VRRRGSTQRGGRVAPPAPGGTGWRIAAGPDEVDRHDGSEEWVWVVTRGPVTRPVTVVAGREAIRARRTGEGPRGVREAVATRGFTLVFDAIRGAVEPPHRIAVGAPARPRRAARR
jgi:hypothetical protein